MLYYTPEYGIRVALPLIAVVACGGIQFLGLFLTHVDIISGDTWGPQGVASGSRVDMLTSPVAAARAAVATGAWVKSKHDSI